MSAAEHTHDLKPKSFCFHCDDPVPTAGPSFESKLIGELRHFCCAGCQAVATTIVEHGLEDYYQFREGANEKPLIPEALETELYDHPALKNTLINESGNTSEAVFYIEGITCAACAWLIEHTLKQNTAVLSATLNTSSHKLNVQWQQEELSLSELLTLISTIGYRAIPFQPDAIETELSRDHRMALYRLGLGGLATMQVMMFSVGLYFGAFQGIDDQYKDFLHWVSLFVATPVVLFSGLPFYKSAWRGIKHRKVGMDLPVSIAILIAYVSSVFYVLFDRDHEVYFDSVTMFIFFLSIARYFEMRSRHHAIRATNRLLQMTAKKAHRVTDDGTETIPVEAVETGDVLLIKAGESVPVDCTIIEGASEVDEALLTGESLPIAKQIGDTLMGGSQNVTQPIKVQATAAQQGGVMSWMHALVERAQAEKPLMAQLADRWASTFVLCVLLAATLTGLVWSTIDSDRAFPIALSVLVATCPCALSLATPTALSHAIQHLLHRGILVSRSHVIETLTQMDHIVFDKTGTLTEGRFELQHQVTVGEHSEAICFALAAELEANSEHPLSHAFRSPDNSSSPDTGLELHDIHFHQQGVSANCLLTDSAAVTTLRLGTPHFALQNTAEHREDQQPNIPKHIQALAGIPLLLTENTQPLAWFIVDDKLRADAQSTLSSLRAIPTQRGHTPQFSLLSGDSSQAPQRVATLLQIENVHSGVDPQQKLTYVQQLANSDQVVAMVGDGVNDAPVLGAAHLSMALGSGTDLAKTTADVVLTNNKLSSIVDAIKTAQKTKRIIKQNMLWAVGYNVCVLPIAAMGLLPPYMAAAGMSLSSLIVVINATRAK